MKTIIFDFDGVLADTFDTVVSTVKKLGPEYDIRLKNIRLLRNLPMRTVLKKINVPLRKVPFFARKLKQEMNKKIKRVNTFSGIKPALRKLSISAHLGIVSSNSRASIEAFLKKHNMQYFDFVFTDTPIFGKAHMLRHAMKTHKLKAKDAVYICDQIVDVQAAKKVKITSVAVGWGYNSPVSLKKAKPKLFVKKPAELMKILNKL